MSTTPMSPSEASVSTTKGNEKFGIARTGARIKASFKEVNALSVDLFHSKAPFFRRSVKGLLINA